MNATKFKVFDKSTMNELHQFIQVVMGSTISQLFQFIVKEWVIADTILVDEGLVTEDCVDKYGYKKLKKILMKANHPIIKKKEYKEMACQ
jgi:hypothetical protein